MNLGGTIETDSVVLTATGQALDSLAVEMEFFVDGSGAYREAWRSDYDLIDQDSVKRAGPEAILRFLQEKYRRTLRSVSRAPFDVEQMQFMGDTTILRQFSEPLKHQVSFSYGYESFVVLGYDKGKRAFVLLWSCC